MIVMKGCLQLVLQVFCVQSEAEQLLSVEIDVMCKKMVGQQKSERTDHFSLFLRSYNIASIHPASIPPSLTHHTTHKKV
jgi:hypothetical protein